MGNACGKPRDNINVHKNLNFDVSRIDKGQLRVWNGEFLTESLVSDMIEALKKQVKENDDNSQAHLNLGICLYHIGYYEVSEIHLVRSKALKKTFESEFLLGLIYLNKNKVKESQSHLKTCVNEFSFLCAYVKLGEVLLRRNKFSFARKVAKKGLELYPNNGELMTLIGMSYMPSNLAKAYKFTKKAAKLDSELFKPYINLAEIRKVQERYEDAINYYRIGLEKGNTLQKGFALLLLASLYFEIGKLEEAVSYFKDSIAANPALINVMKNRGFDCIFIDPEIQFCIKNIINKDYDAALKRLKSLYKQNKSNIAAIYFLALANNEKGEKEKSKRYYKKIISLSLNSDQTHLIKLLANKSEFVLNQILKQEKEDIPRFETENLNSSPLDEPKEIDNQDDEQEELLTVGGSYPNFNETIKAQEISEGLKPINNLHSEPTKFFPSHKNSLRRFASSADPEPENCLLF